MLAAQEGKLISEIERIVLGRIASGRLVVPAMPAIATRCLAILREPSVHHKKLVAAMEADPLLSALIVRAANAAAHGAAVKGLDQAVARLGEQKLKTLIVEYASRELFQSSERRIAEANRRLWEHSVAVAHLARDLAAFTSSVDSDACFLAGLLHDVGKPLLAAMLLEAERQLSRGAGGWIDPTAWVNAIESGHRKVGLALATEWKLPPEVTAAIRDASEYDAADRTSATNIVRLANAVAKREGYATGPIDADDVDAMIMLGRSMIGADEQVIASLASSLKNRLSSVMA